MLQAVGAGILAPLALATTAMVFPPEQRGLGLATIAVVANVAAAIGPLLGGALVEYASWHWIFAINVPIGVAGVLLALRDHARDLRPDRRAQRRLVGMVLIGGAVFCLTYGAGGGPTRAAGDRPTIVALFAASVLLAAGFAASQRYGRSPMLTRGLVRNRQFMGASARLRAVRDGGDGAAVPGGDRLREPVGLLADRGRARDRRRSPSSA